jgi:hypothetical protein
VGRDEAAPCDSLSHLTRYATAWGTYKYLADKGKGAYRNLRSDSAVIDKIMAEERSHLRQLSDLKKSLGKR